jgi:transcriptional regulator with XRE-family HTH domain
VDITAAQKIRDLRLQAGCSQAEVAEESGYTRQQYSAVECGHIEASAETYLGIERAIIRLTSSRAASVVEMAGRRERSSSTLVTA